MLKLKDVLPSGEFLGDKSIIESSYVGLSIDSRRVEKGQVFIAIKGKRHDGHDFVEAALRAGANLAIVERELPHRPILVVGNTLEALWEIARRVIDYYSPFRIGITGTCGKTTVKEMLYTILSNFKRVEKTKGNENNLIGLPLNIANMGDCDVFIAELGTNSPGEISTLSDLFKPNIAVITAIGEGHLEGLRSLDGVFNEKIGILNGMDGGILVFPGDSPFFEKACKIADSKGIGIVPFYGSEVTELEPGYYRFSIDGRDFEEPFGFSGLHMGIDALIAIKTAKIFGVEVERAIEALKSFSPVKSRFNVIKFSNFTLIDDTYNANPVSTRNALLNLSKFRGRKIFVFGSMMELGDKSEELHREIGLLAFKCGVELMYTFGEFARFALDEFLSQGGSGSHYQTHGDLLSDLLREVREGDVILVKGSRAMAMERIVEGILECYGN